MKRVHYFTGQLLTPEDFQVEQDYHLNERRRLNLRVHGIGVVSGLHVSVESDGVSLSAGLAVDRYGDEIVVGEPQLIRFPTGSSPIWLVITYIEGFTAPVPAADDQGVQHNRIEEGFKLEYATNPEEDEINLACLRWTNEHWRVEKTFRLSLVSLGLVTVASALSCLLCSRRR